MNRTIPAPMLGEESEAFWLAAREERLLIGHCDDCGAAHYHPRRICPHCHSAAVTMREAAGTGEIYSFSVMRRSETPYAIAYVKLDEGVTMMTNLVDCDLDALAIGSACRCASWTRGPIRTARSGRRPASRRSTEAAPSQAACTRRKFSRARRCFTGA